MTDSDLALAYAKVFEVDAAFAGHAQQTTDEDEAGRAVAAARLTAPLKRQIEQWIAGRASRAVRLQRGA